MASEPVSGDPEIEVAHRSQAIVPNDFFQSEPVSFETRMGKDPGEGAFLVQANTRTGSRRRTGPSSEHKGTNHPHNSSGTEQIPPPQ